MIFNCLIVVVIKVCTSPRHIYDAQLFDGGVTTSRVLLLFYLFINVCQSDVMLSWGGTERKSGFALDLFVR